MSHLTFPDGIDEAIFLRAYWQKQPLLLRSALPGFRCALDPDELAGLACEEVVESRLVLETRAPRPWEVHHGPFSETDFQQLPASHWTLLVQNVDKQVPEIATLLDYFRFIPEWRVDDVMISYAVDQGSVGPHIDEYDVFLLQARGRRRWRISHQPRQDDECIPDLDLRILPDFETDQEWILEPGDLLYLPPRLAHWGVALGECMTCSVGFRAPSHREMLSSWCDSLIDDPSLDERYRDPALRPQSASAEILPEINEQIGNMLHRCLNADPDRVRRWFGRFVTEPKSDLDIEPRQYPLSSPELRDRFTRLGWLRRHGYARMAFSRGAADQDYLFVNGRLHGIDKAQGDFLSALTRDRDLHLPTVARWLAQPDCLQLLTDLYNQGCYLFDDD